MIFEVFSNFLRSEDLGAGRPAGRPAGRLAGRRAGRPKMKKKMVSMIKNGDDDGPRRHYVCLAQKNGDDDNPRRHQVCLTPT